METSLLPSVVIFTSNENGVNCITSIQVSKMFGREHKNVLRLIYQLLGSCKLTSSQSEPVEFKDAKGEMRPMFLLTESGFAVLVSSFNLDSDEDKNLQREILQRFNEYILNALKEVKQLRQRNKDLEEAERKAIGSPHPRSKTPKNGYIVIDDGSEYGKVKRVLRKDYDELELIDGEVAQNNNIIFGLTKKITKLLFRKCEILKGVNND